MKTLPASGCFLPSLFILIQSGGEPDKPTENPAAGDLLAAGIMSGERVDQH